MNQLEYNLSIKNCNALCSMIFVFDAITDCRDNNSFLQGKLQTSKLILLKFEKLQVFYGCKEPQIFYEVCYE